MSWLLDNESRAVQVMKSKYTASIFPGNLTATPHLIAFAHRNSIMTCPLNELLPHKKPTEMHMPLIKVGSNIKDAGTAVSHVLGVKLYNINALAIVHENGCLHVRFGDMNLIFCVELLLIYRPFPSIDCGVILSIHHHFCYAPYSLTD